MPGDHGGDPPRRHLLRPHDGVEGQAVQQGFPLADALGRFQVIG
ncbi:MAG TPA: hypothetical protein VND02_07790 [Actinomycetota bacterium]|nr:hypothetical protein [Actinomycetota bacterium]